MASVSDVLNERLIELNDYAEIRISEEDLNNFKDSIIYTQTKDLHTGDWVITFSKIDRGNL